LSNIGGKFEIHGINENGVGSVGKLGGIWPYGRKRKSKSRSAGKHGDNNCDDGSTAHVG
jgi:hypothetical protein